VRLAYADPPYPGQAKRSYGDHPDYAGEVDHAELIDRLMGYDGWALSTSEQALQEVLALCPRKGAGAKGRRYQSFSGVRVIVWTKGGCPFPNEGMHAFEPVIVRGARAPEANLRDWINCEPDYFQWRPRPPEYVKGQKPGPVIDWILRWLGARPGDELDDLFPGSGAVARAWAASQSQLTLAEASA
jgi:hypothetical protein